MTRDRRSRKTTAPAGLKTPPSKRKNNNKDSQDTASTNSLSSMSMSFDGCKPNIVTPPFKGMKKKEIPWTNKEFLDQAFQAVGVEGSIEEALKESRNIELLLGAQRKPYEITLQRLGITDNWSTCKTKDYRSKVGKAVANTLQGKTNSVEQTLISNSLKSPPEGSGEDQGSELGNLKTEGLPLDFSSLKSEEPVPPAANIHYTVSHGIQDNKGNLNYYVILDKTGAAWMLKSGFIGTLFNVVITQYITPQGKDVPHFMQHFHEVPLKGPNGKYKRSAKKKNGKGWVGTKIATIVQVPKNGLPPRICVNDAIDRIGNFMKRKDIGQMLATWLGREIPTLYRHFAKNKNGGPPKVSKEEIGTDLTETLNNEFKSYACDYHVHLSDILCDYEIKQFIVNHLGFNSFEDMDETELGKIYSYYPQKPHPTWENIVKESY